MPIAVMALICAGLMLISPCLAWAQVTAQCVLHWTAPTTNADDSPLTDLAGYVIYLGKPSGRYRVGGYAEPRETSKPCRDVGIVKHGHYWVTMAAFDISGNISELAEGIPFKIVK